MASRKRQTSLQSFLGGSKRLALEHQVADSESIPVNQDPESLVSEFDVYSGEDDLEPELDQVDVSTESNCESTEITNADVCNDICCSNDTKPFQPSDKALLRKLTRNGRNFVSGWFKEYPWLTMCISKNSVLCMYCKSAAKHGLLQFSHNSNSSFVKSGFSNWKKAKEKFNNHALSLVHKEALLKWSSLNRPSIVEHINSGMTQLQTNRRTAFLLQLHALKFLLRQGLALRNHTDSESNLNQLLLTWSKRKEFKSVMLDWLKNKKIHVSHYSE